MSIPFKVIERGQPGVAGGGTKKYYATGITTGETNIEALTTRIEKISTVSGADVRAVLYALVDVATDELAEGRIVRLGDLGSMRVSISSHGHDTPEEVTAHSVKNQKVLFTPGSKIKNMLKTLGFYKAPTP
ncbi:HU family DNA-binding protein [Abyssalbus ytuae]|uniref:DNA-binding protein n=1 Tax=Abyssalbus ytuae TaxID=2926907 RepID=A0A9E7CY96_9FLAO|nr:HU family DNA-binding protein [Abyssalbus ytuae]UOB16420.1 DNA-binding protein [Abyssalbus ytuae]